MQMSGLSENFLAGQIYEAILSNNQKFLAKMRERLIYNYKIEIKKIFETLYDRNMYEEATYVLENSGISESELSDIFALLVAEGKFNAAKDVYRHVKNLVTF